jgi:predicted ATPase
VGGRSQSRFVRVHLCLDEVELAVEADAVRTSLAGLRVQVDADRTDRADVFVGVYGDRYGEIEAELGVSRLEQHYLAAGARPRLVYVVPGSGERDPHLALLLSRIQADDLTSYRRVSGPDELATLVADDLAMVLTEAFTAEVPGRSRSPEPVPALARPSPSPRARIPAPWHRLVGRETEADQVCRLLTSGTRLLTLTGPGGIGKSRLAIEVASRCSTSFPDGAWFVDLAGMRDPALVAPTIAHALGIRESAAALPVQSLKAYLAPMRALILLDSFETVTSAAPLLVDLLGSAPQVSFFVTSRSVLRVRGEQEYSLPPLDVPRPGSTDPRASSALELFLERAAAANPTRVLSASEQEAAAEICRRLDGVPLALELAAARTRLLAPSTLLGKLEHALDVLGSGPVDLPARQRALRTTLDWDHDLLSDDEKVVLRRLSVFPRQFTLSVAEQVVGDPGLDVFDALDGLVGKSLVRSFDAELPGEPRFVLLQTVREYAHEHLDAAGENGEIHRRHAAYVLERVELADRASPAELEGWLVELERQHDDIRVALDWADRALEVDTLVGLASSLGTFWRSHCHFSEGRRWLDRALALTAGQRTGTRAELLNAAGFISRARGDYDAAEAQYREALAIREELGQPDKVAASMRYVGNVAYERGDLDGAEDWWRRSLGMLDDSADDERLMSVLNNLGVLAHHRGDQHEAIRLYDETFELGRRLGSRELQARAQMNKAQALAVLGEASRSFIVAQSAVAIYADLDDTWDLVDALDVLAGAAGRDGRTELSGWLFGGAASLRVALDVRRPLSEDGDYELGRSESRIRDPELFDAAYAAGGGASLAQIVDRATGVGCSP